MRGGRFGRGFKMEEERLTGTQDIGLFKKLLKYIKKPYWKIITIVFVLSMITSVFDIFLPYLTKIAIDDHIVPPYRILNFKNYPELEQEFLEKFKGEKIKIEPERYIVKKRDISSYELKLYEKRGILEKGLYVEIFEIKEDIGIIQAENRNFVKYENLSKFSPLKILKIRKKDIESIKNIALIYLAILLLLGILTYLHMVLLQYVGQKLMIDIRMGLFSHVLKLPMNFFDKNPVGRLVTRVTNDISALNEFFTSVLVYLFKDILLIIGITAIMFKMNVRITLIILALSPFIAIATTIFRKKVREAYREVRRKLAFINSFIQESLSSISIIQSYNQEKNNYRKFDDINDQLFKANMRQLIVFATFSPIIDFIRAFAIALLVFFSGWNIMTGAFTLGALAAFLSYVEMLFRPIMDLSEKYNIFQSAMAATERIVILLDEKQEHRGDGKIGKRKGEIIFDDLWMKYDEGEWILKGISFKVNPGERVAIVGPTGSGKTSLISSLLKFYPVQKGRIIVDGVDIKEWNTYELRKRIALVLQDVFIFSGNFADNISLRDDKPSIERIKKSTRRVYAHEFIESKNNSYFEEIAERGKNLSQGEKQLLSFARALYFDPEILILDEPTSSVDSYTEHLIQKGIKELLKDRTSLIIAHRLSTIRNCDKIIVIHNGKIVETGTHEELIDKKGLYAKLWELQIKEKELVFG